MLKFSYSYYRNNTPLVLHLLNRFSKNGKVYTEKDLEGTIGIVYSEVNDKATVEPNPKITRFSELRKDWHADTNCLNCGRLFVVNNEKLNTLSTCKCGQGIAVLAPENIL